MAEPSSLSPEYVRLISAHQAALYSYILSLNPNRSWAQDILQETNLILWQKASHFTLGSNFKAWAFRIAFLQTLAHRKTVARTRAHFIDDDIIHQLAEESSRYSEGTEARHQALKHCLNRISAEDLSLLKLHYTENLPFAQLSQQTGRSVGAIKQIFLRIRRSLRTCIERSVHTENILPHLHRPEPDPT